MTQSPSSLQSISGYSPLNDSEYMSPEMVRYFKDKLNAMHKEVLAKEKAIAQNLLEDTCREPDPLDRSVTEELCNTDLTLHEHEDHLRREIEEALQRLDDDSYGYCEATDEPIGVRRLDVMPTARYCLAVQEKKEAETLTR